MSGVTVFCLLCAIIYNYFGHGVHSVHMDYMFLYPLILGVLFYVNLNQILQVKVVSRLFFNTYNSGIVTLIIGSMLKGIFEIAGTRSPYTRIYMWVGIGLILIGIISYLISYIIE